MMPMIRRGFLEDNQVNWRPIRHAEDLVYLTEVLLAGARFGLSGWAGYRYTQRRGSASGTRSAASRTRRSVQEQQAAVRLLQQDPRIAEDAVLTGRLRRMLGEIVVTQAVLDVRDAVEDRAWGQAGLAVARAVSRPFAFARSVAARFGPAGSRLV